MGATGTTTSAYRPRGAESPLSARNRFLRLHAAFSGLDGRFARPNGYGNALWYGVFDAAYTLPGDYLVQQDSTWFIAAQQKLLPVWICTGGNPVTCNAPPETL